MLQLPGQDMENQELQDKLDALAYQFPVYARFLETPVTSLPASPQDGQVITYTADATNGVSWLLRYRAASASTYKWEFVGGSPLFDEKSPGDETTASATYAALATAGPSIALPLAGDYDVEIGAKVFDTSAGAAFFMSYDIGGTGAQDGDAFDGAVAVGSTDILMGSRMRRKTGLTAVTLTAKYRVGGGTGHFNNRWMRVTPVRVG